MSIASEFKEFVARGNVMDLAVGVVIGRTSEYFDYFVIQSVSGIVDFSEARDDK